MICTNCSREVPDTARVCGYCGHRLKTDAEPSAGVESAQSIVDAPPGAIADLETSGPASDAARWALVAGVVLMVAPSMPWFRLFGVDGWGVRLDIGRQRIIGDVPPSLVSFGLIVFVLGAIATLLAIRGSASKTRRVLGVLAIVTVAVATWMVGTDAVNGLNGMLRWVEVGPWMAAAAAVILLTGR